MLTCGSNLKVLLSIGGWTYSPVSGVIASTSPGEKLKEECFGAGDLTWY
jgi:GH18 family chitinase